MKTVLILFALCLPSFGATNAEIEVQIDALMHTLHEQQVDSIATVLNTLVQNDANYVTLKNAGVIIVKQANPAGKYDPMWIGVDFPLTAVKADTLGDGEMTSTALMSAMKIDLALGLLKTQYRGRDCGVEGRLKLHKNRLKEANDALALLFQ